MVEYTLAQLDSSGFIALVLLACKKPLRKAVVTSLLTVGIGAACIHQFGPNAVSIKACVCQI